MNILITVALLLCLFILFRIRQLAPLAELKRLAMQQSCDNQNLEGNNRLFVSRFRSDEGAIMANRQALEALTEAAETQARNTENVRSVAQNAAGEARRALDQMSQLRGQTERVFPGQVTDLNTRISRAFNRLDEIEEKSMLDDIVPESPFVDVNARCDELIDRVDELVLDHNDAKRRIIDHVIPKLREAEGVSTIVLRRLNKIESRTLFSGFRHEWKMGRARVLRHVELNMRGWVLGAVAIAVFALVW